MADYVTPRLAFVLRGSLEQNVWPFDPRDIFTTMRYRMDWSSLEAGFRESFAASLDGAPYAAMVQAAHEAMAEYCSIARVHALLADALGAKLPALKQAAAE